ncbi:hypothetical protein C8Q75DRAFT_57350 [Abortiporus biennis]|nr:hypothetical protein C8Q75DRAFT_57350 [Abortiporus biennis]
MTVCTGFTYITCGFLRVPPQPRMPPSSPSLLRRTSMAAICSGVSQHNCVDLFQNSASLRREGNLEAAFSSFESCLRNCGAEELEELLWAVCSVPNGFAFMYASLSSDCAAIVSETLFATIPSTAEDFASSLISTVLGQLSKSFWFVEYLGSRTLREHHQAVDFSLAALQTIPNMSFKEAGTTKDGDDRNDGHGKRKTQRHLKNARKYKKPMIDTTAFEKLNVAVPTSQQEADNLVATIIADQRDILKYYLFSLRLSEHAATFQQLLAGEPHTEDDGRNETAPNGGFDDLHDTIPDDTPSAYPFVQPKKAALYFETAEGFGDWRILISTRADRALRETRKKDPNLFKIIVKKIKELSNGHFSDDNQKRLTGSSGNNIPIYEAKMTSDTRLVYHIDCLKDYDSEVEWQAIRIFGLYTHAKLDERLWSAVSNQLSGQGKEYRRRCMFRKPPLGGGRVYQPASFPPLEVDSPTSPTAVRIPNLRTEDRDELHGLLVLEKFVTFSQALLNSILADQNVAHVFQMSAKEQEIVRHTRSCFVLGRSGTGKTTTMLFKILGIERTYDDQHQDLPRPRQVFVTKSQVLADKVQEYYLKLSQSHAAGKLNKEEYATSVSKMKARKSIGLVNRDEEGYHYDDLPKSYSELQDSQFPLFLKFDHLCRLLEGDFMQTTSSLADNPTSLTLEYIQRNRKSLVTFNIFRTKYWQHFPQNLTKNLDPALVFAEIIGVIKGSERTRKSEKGYLDRNEYLDLSQRSQCTFASHREMVYAIFQSYLKLKAERREYDDADRARLLIRNINNAGIQGRKLDFIYVDEAQDNLIIDAFVLRSMCRNPNGLFWAGDTAQTISAGSAFRFTDLKASMYEYNSELVQNDSGVKSPMQELPRTFELTVNYRSHGGIMGCANSVIKLITQFWPDAIDNMAEEKGVVDGVKPLFFHGWGQDTVRYEQFLFGASGDHIEFGHHQCILVRDAAARDKLKSEVGEIGIIMTIYDSKGLEFDDVLLYNFFEDSPVQLARWRVVLNAIASDEGGCPRFDEVRHASVCRELKFLYVAITRARKNLWIADASTKGEPMRSIWNHPGLIHNCTPGDKIPHLAVSSTQEEWAETGRHLFTLERYPQAAHCYQRAGMVREKDIALAYHTRYELQARSWRRGMDHERISAFVAIAEEFLRLAAISPLEELTYYRIAGECFAEVGEDRRAAEAYLRAKEYSSSAKSYRNAECFDEAVEIVQSHTTSIASTDAQSIINAAKIVWFKEPKSYEKAIALFPGVDCALKFTEDYEFDDARLDILVKQTEYPGIEAADLYFFKHEYHRAIRIYLDNHCTSKAQECLLTVFWRYASFGSRIDEAELIPLIQLSREVAKHPEVSNHVKDQLRMFEAIISQDFHQLEDLGVGFYEHDTVTISNTLLCLDYAYNNLPEVQTCTTLQVATFLRRYSIYVNLLKNLAFGRLFNNPIVSRLFAVDLSEHGVATIPDRSFLYAPAMADPYITKPKLEQEVACSEISVRICDLPRILGPALRKRLSSRVQKLHDPFWLSAFQPCMTFAVLGQCKIKCHMSHVPPDVLDVNFYHSRLQMHFQHILTCRGVFIGRREKASFITMLYHALKPSTTHLGSEVDYSPSHQLLAKIGTGAMQTIEGWVQDLLYSADSYTKNQPFLSRMITLFCIAFSLNANSARVFIPKALSHHRDRPSELHRSSGKRYILDDLFVFLDGNDVDSITAGTLFLRHVIDGRFSVDIGVLCDLIDMVYGSVMIIDRLQRYQNLHNLALPRTWLLAIAGDNRLKTKKMEWTTQKPLLLSVKSLLDDVYNHADHLYLVNRSLYKYDFQVANILVGRLCRTISLFGYNVVSYRDLIQRDVISALTSLVQEGRTFHSLYTAFIQAGEWRDVTYAIKKQQVYYGCNRDPLIQLKQQSRVLQPVFTPWGMHTVIYEQVEDIVPLIRRNERDGDVHTRVNGQVSDTGTFLDDNAAQGDSKNDTQESNGCEDELEYSAHNPDAVEMISGHYLSLMTVSEEYLAAVSAMQRQYRRLISRRREKEIRQSDPFNMLFSACVEASHSFGIRYKTEFRNVLPHALSCLNKMYLGMEKLKKDALKRMKKAHTRELDEATDLVDEVKLRFNEVKSIQKLLSPLSDFHKKQDLVTFKNNVLSIERLSTQLQLIPVKFNPSTSLPQTEMNEWKKDLEEALQRLKIARIPQKNLKPRLNVDDLDPHC